MKLKEMQYFIFGIFLIGCNISAQDRGIVLVHSYFPSTDSMKARFEPQCRIFFSGNKSIQEVPLLVFSSDTSGAQTTHLKIKHYSYLDPTKNICYNYSSFSDTAQVLNMYESIDSVGRDGGWNFLSTEKFEYDSSKNLPDTLINDVSHGRIKLFKKFNSNSIYLIIYFRCDKKNTLVASFKSLSDSIGCPIVRDDTYIKGKLFMTTELKYISDTLSQGELKVFDVWERNVKKFPVQR
jgi:hypothetical protein